MGVLESGSNGPDVSSLQDNLRTAGFSPGIADGNFGPGTQAAVVAFQRSEGLLADGIVGPRTAAALQLPNPPEIPSPIPCVTAELVSPMFSSTLVRNIQQNLPVVL